MADGGKPSAVSLDGEIVEIIEAGGVSSLRVFVHHLSVFDLASPLVNELHLGDRIALDGVLHVDGVRSLPDAEPATRHAAPVRPGNDE